MPNITVPHIAERRQNGRSPSDVDAQGDRLMSGLATVSELAGRGWRVPSGIIQGPPIRPSPLRVSARTASPRGTLPGGAPASSPVLSASGAGHVLLHVGNWDHSQATSAGADIGDAAIEAAANAISRDADISRHHGHAGGVTSVGGGSSGLARSGSGHRLGAGSCGPSDGGSSGGGSSPVVAEEERAYLEAAVNAALACAAEAELLSSDALPARRSWTAVRAGGGNGSGGSGSPSGPDRTGTTPPVATSLLDDPSVSAFVGVADGDVEEFSTRRQSAGSEGPEEEDDEMEDFAPRHTPAGMLAAVEEQSTPPTGALAPPSGSRGGHSASPSSSGPPAPMSLDAYAARIAARGLGRAPRERVPLESLGSRDPRWSYSSRASACAHCAARFSLLSRKHFCRGCGAVLCAACTPYAAGDMKRICKPCNALRQGRVLRPAGFAHDVMHWIDAVATGDLLEVETRLARGMDVSASNPSDGLTALHVAAGWRAYVNHRLVVAGEMAERAEGSEGAGLRAAASRLPPGPLQRAALGELRPPSAGLRAPSAGELYTYSIVLQQATLAAEAAAGVPELISPLPRSPVHSRTVSIDFLDLGGDLHLRLHDGPRQGRHSLSEPGRVPSPLSPILTSFSSLVSAAAGKLSSLSLSSVGALGAGLVTQAAGAVVHGQGGGAVDASDFAVLGGGGGGSAPLSGGGSPDTPSPTPVCPAVAPDSAGEKTAVALVRLLLAAGASVDCTTAAGRTPLHAAVMHGSAGVLQLLLDAGARQGHADKNGLTPYDYASLRAGRDEPGAAEVLSLLDADYSSGTLEAHSRSEARTRGVSLPAEGGLSPRPENPLSAAAYFARAEALPLPLPSQLEAAGVSALDPAAAALQANLLAVTNGAARLAAENAWLECYVSASDGCARSVTTSVRSRAAALGLLLPSSGLGWGRELELVGSVWRAGHPEGAEADVTPGVEDAFRRLQGVKYVPPLGIANALAAGEWAEEAEEGGADAEEGCAEGVPGAVPEPSDVLAGTGGAPALAPVDAASAIRRTKFTRGAPPVVVPMSIPRSASAPLLDAGDLDTWCETGSAAKCKGHTKSGGPCISAVQRAGEDFCHLHAPQALLRCDLVSRLPPAWNEVRLTTWLAGHGVGLASAVILPCCPEEGGKAPSDGSDCTACPRVFGLVFDRTQHAHHTVPALIARVCSLSTSMPATLALTAPAFERVHPSAGIAPGAYCSCGTEEAPSPTAPPSQCSGEACECKEGCIYYDGRTPSATSTPAPLGTSAPLGIDASRGRAFSDNSSDGGMRTPAGPWALGLAVEDAAHARARMLQQEVEREHAEVFAVPGSYASSPSYPVSSWFQPGSPLLPLQGTGTGTLASGGAWELGENGWAMLGPPAIGGSPSRTPQLSSLLAPEGSADLDECGGRSLRSCLKRASFGADLSLLSGPSSLSGASTTSGSTVSSTGGSLILPPAREHRSSSNFSAFSLGAVQSGGQRRASLEGDTRRRASISDAPPAIAPEPLLGGLGAVLPGYWGGDVGLRMSRPPSFQVQGAVPPPADVPPPSLTASPSMTAVRACALSGDVSGVGDDGGFQLARTSSRASLSLRRSVSFAAEKAAAAEASPSSGAPPGDAGWAPGASDASASIPTEVPQGMQLGRATAAWAGSAPPRRSGLVAVPDGCRTHRPGSAYESDEELSPSSSDEEETSLICSMSDDDAGAAGVVRATASAARLVALQPAVPLAISSARPASRSWNSMDFAQGANASVPALPPPRVPSRSWNAVESSSSSPVLSLSSGRTVPAAPPPFPSSLSSSLGGLGGSGLSLPYLRGGGGSAPPPSRDGPVRRKGAGGRRKRQPRGDSSTGTLSASDSDEGGASGSGSSEDSSDCGSVRKLSGTSGACTPLALGRPASGGAQASERGQ
jgi:hypothetical protein